MSDDFPTSVKSNGWAIGPTGKRYPTNGRDVGPTGKRTGLSPGSRRTQFKKGHDGRKGRTPGVPNRITRVLREAVLLAAEECKGSLVEYLRWIAQTEPRAFVTLLNKLLPLQMNVDRFTQTVYRSYAEVSVALADQGLSLQAIEKLKSIDMTAPDVDDPEPAEENKDV